MTLYEKVKLAAEKKGISIHKLEVMAGIGNGVIGRWREFAPKIGTLQKVAEVLEMDVKELL